MQEYMQSARNVIVINKSQSEIKEEAIAEENRILEKLYEITLPFYCHYSVSTNKRSILK